MMSCSMTVARAVCCELQPPRQAPRVGPDSLSSSSSNNNNNNNNPGQVKVVLQPRMCTLRSYASAERGSGVIRTIVAKPKDGGDGGGGEEVVFVEEEALSPFLANLYEYIESSKKSQDFEIITGRLAMIVFAATIGAELATGNSVFKKMDIQGIAEGLGACLVAMSCAAGFAYSSSARKKVGRIFTISCNAFIDALIDNIIDNLFYDDDENGSSGGTKSDDNKL